MIIDLRIRIYSVSTNLINAPPIMKAAAKRIKVLIQNNHLIIVVRLRYRAKPVSTI